MSQSNRPSVDDRSSAAKTGLVLLFDLGNTMVKWAIALNGEIKFFGRFEFSSALLNSHLEEVGQCVLGHAFAASFDSVQVCSVASSAIRDELCNKVSERWGLQANVVKVARSFRKLENSYSDLTQLGVDRWVAVVGAAYPQSNELFANPKAHVEVGAKIVIDVGTAATVEYLKIEQDYFEYLGGAILPGRDLMRKALNQNTAKIEAHPVSVDQPFGTSTSECVNVGVQYGLPGAVYSVVSQMMSQHAVPTQILVCGGGAEPVVEYFEQNRPKHVVSVEHSPDLIFTGLIALSA